MAKEVKKAWAVVEKPTPTIYLERPQREESSVLEAASALSHKQKGPVRRGYESAWKSNHPKRETKSTCLKEPPKTPATALRPGSAAADYGPLYIPGGGGRGWLSDRRPRSATGSLPLQPGVDGNDRGLLRPVTASPSGKLSSLKQGGLRRSGVMPLGGSNRLRYNTSVGPPYSKLGDHSHFRPEGRKRYDVGMSTLTKHTAGSRALVKTDSRGHTEDTVECLLCGQFFKTWEHELHKKICSAVPMSRVETMARRDHAIFEMRRLNNAAALKIQTWYRGYLARCFCELKAKVELRVIILVQSHIRKFVATNLKYRLWQRRLYNRVQGLITLGSVMANQLQFRRKHALMLQKHCRGLLGRLKATRWWKGREIQRVWRGAMGRVAAHANQINMFILKNMKRYRVQLMVLKWRRSVAILEKHFYKTRMRWNLFEAIEKVTKPITAARKLQGAVRRYWGRRAVHYISKVTYIPIPIQCAWRQKVARKEMARQNREKRCRMIQRAARRKMARVHLWEQVAVRHYAVIWCQRRMRQKWLKRSAKYYWLLLRTKLGAMMCLLAEKLLTHGHISEGRKIYLMLEFYRECGLGSKRDLQRLKVLRQYTEFAVSVRSVFLHVSTHGVNNPDKAFRISAQQFTTFVKDMGCMNRFETPAQLNILFAKCNSNTFEKAGTSKLGIVGDEEDCMGITNSPGKKGEKPEEEDRVLEMDEFLEALVRLANLFYPDEGDVADRLRVFVKTDMIPYMNKFQAEEAKEDEVWSHKEKFP